MIFLTSNLGSQEVMKLMTGGLGFSAGRNEDDEELDQKIYRTAMEASRRKFSPEFMNRIDKVIVFRLLSRDSLEKILDIELGRVQRRVMAATEGNPFVLVCTRAARDFLLQEGTNQKFGARHLKRAIERYLVFPISNLLATRQIKLGDLITVDYCPDDSKLTFLKEEQGALVKGLEERVEEVALSPAFTRNATAALALAGRASPTSWERSRE
jgi:ATP-dependent Clp protease ATP-binding subunit ClpA